MDAANLKVRESPLGPQFAGLRLLRGRGSRGGGGHASGRGLLDRGPKLGLLGGDVRLKGEALTDLDGLGGQRLEFGVLLDGALGDVGQLPHPLGDGGSAILKCLELLRHGRPCS